jgi:hypothetical protein
MGVEIRELPNTGGKYFLDERGKVWRRDDAGELFKVAKSGTPARVRLYVRGKESRLFVHVLFERVWSDRPDVLRKVAPPA